MVYYTISSSLSYYLRSIDIDTCHYTTTRVLELQFLLLLIFSIKEEKIVKIKHWTTEKSKGASITVYLV